MKRGLSKVLIVILGYAAALAIGYIAMRIRIAATSGPDRQSAPNMFAAGDSFYFIAVAGLAAIPATALALFFLRPYPLFWRVAGALALCISVAGFAALLSYLGFRDADASTYLGMLAELSPLRFLAAPLLAVVFALSLLFAPTKGTRILFLSAATTEVFIFVWIAFIWFHQPR